LNHLLSLVLIAGGCWLVIALIGGIGQWLASHAGESQRSAVSIRSFQTRIHLLTRVISVVVIVVAVAIVLLNIPSVRQLGASILASAGIAGVVAGFASKSILANILAGLQLAMTEPIRMGDVVVIDKDPGTVEEIGSSFVVVRLGETRRLIVPLNYFLENRFENWSLRSAEHLGTVTLRMDYQVSIKDLRTEMERILNASKHWDHKTGQLQAIDSDEKSIQIKVTVSAANPEELSKLRNDVREGLLTHLQDSRRSHEPPEPIAGSA
jgi:small-conductance mechanosensitive channel